ncbi:MAG: dUTP diphosphatase [Eubacterium sp.]|jgi:dUTP pyrophosphatase|nr:dUTP diphosphatase [Eubacterium sp.]
MIINIKKLSEKAKLPVFATDGSAGADLYACIDAPLSLLPGGRELVPTGLAVEIPKGHGGFVFPRSSLASKYGVSLSNCVGVIDNDYRGEVKIAVINHSDIEYVVLPGDRIAQLVILPFIKADYRESSTIVKTERKGGFGSTGR